jgi:hypothetical protein
MGWQWFTVDDYEVYILGANTASYPGIYAYVVLTLQTGQAFLWFHTDGATIPANSVIGSGASTRYYGRFRQAQFDDCVDLLRNEKPVNFGWNGGSLSVMLGTSQEPVGEAEV